MAIHGIAGHQSALAEPRHVLDRHLRTMAAEHEEEPRDEAKIIGFRWVSMDSQCILMAF